MADVPHYSYQQAFSYRHNQSDNSEIKAILEELDLDSIDELIGETIPSKILLNKSLNLPKAKSEAAFLASFKKLMGKNRLLKNHIGLGYYDTLVPSVILRNVLENPAWYTAYTPYQAEIAQGRLEMLLNFQTMVIELTGMEIANASLLDEGTAAAEAMTMLFAQKPKSKSTANTLFVSEQVLPQTIDILKTRAYPLGIQIEIGNHQHIEIADPKYFGILLQYPAANGTIFEYQDLVASANALEISTIVAADLLSLTLLSPPGEWGADVVVGNTQRFGVPMGFGGPHAAFFATKEKFKRNMPGRIIGVSVDKHGKPALRMALQTREQHIRREKATSNICTAQVLLSIMAASYAIYHGPKGLKNIAEKIHGLASLLKAGLNQLNLSTNESFFDTISLEAGNHITSIQPLALEAGRNFGYQEKTIRIALDETSELEDVYEILAIFEKTLGKKVDLKALESSWNFPDSLVRNSTYLNHPIFNSHQSEHSMLRYLKRLENKDLSMVHSMISLGSCTMKLNATTEMIPVTWPEMGKMHPFAPQDQSLGYQEMIQELGEWLKEITQFKGVSMQPNSGAQGEFAGLLTIRNYLLAKGESHRNIALIPASAHGTNPASAVMAGMKVIVTPCDEKGNINVAELKEKAIEHKDHLACLMITYPSTHGVFEESIQEICEIIHENGGQVYMDGANMNAQVGLTSPATIGADVCHLNLHKTFCIPHGGGGPGMGPICVAEHLVEHLPGHIELKNSKNTAVSAAPFGSASILAISYAYIAMMGAEGITEATKMAILNANYIKSRLRKHYPILYTGKFGRCAHEFILDLRPFKNSAGLEAEDIAKRLMDYGFHSPTLSFPVAGTLMIEPTESENKAELDRFCDAMISIRKEIQEIEEGKADPENNVLKNAPHTQFDLMTETWNYPYSREKAAFPLEYIKDAKFWPSVSRINAAFGDRNLVCSCLPIENYQD